MITDRTAGVPVLKQVDGELPAGAALPIARARLIVGDKEYKSDVGPQDTRVRFTMPLTEGSTQAQTWFYDANGNELCGAYYVYVSRK